MYFCSRILNLYYVLHSLCVKLHLIRVPANRIPRFLKHIRLLVYGRQIWRICRLRFNAQRNKLNHTWCGGLFNNVVAIWSGIGDDAVVWTSRLTYFRFAWIDIGSGVCLVSLRKMFTSHLSQYVYTHGKADCMFGQ